MGLQVRRRQRLVNALLNILQDSVHQGSVNEIRMGGLDRASAVGESRENLIYLLWCTFHYQLQCY